MKIFKIGEWDADSGLTNYATSWVISKKIDRSEVIVEVLESTDYINNWSVNLEMPIGEIYYLQVLRHFKDSDGNVVVYDDWIGPRKLISDDNETSEALINKTYILEPYISKISVDFTNGLTVEVDEPIANIPVLSTNFIIRDKNNKTVASSINDSINKTKITFPNSENANFTTMDKIYISVSFNGEQSTLSPTTNDVTSYVSNLYKVEGNITNINIDGESIAYITSTNDNFIALSKASLLTLDKVFINEVVVDSGMIKIKSNILKYDTTYILSLDIEYNDPTDNTTKTKTVEHFVSTAKESEYSYFSKFIEFKNEIKPIALDQTIFKDNEVVVSEQSVYGIIPMIKDSKIFLYKVGVDDESYVLVKDSGVTITGNLTKFEFLPNNELVVFYNDTNSNLLYKLYNYNPYDNMLTYLNGGDTGFEDSAIYNNSFALIGKRYYFFNTNDNNLAIKYLDLDTKVIVDYKTIDLPGVTNISRLTVQPIGYNKIIILPQTDNSEVFTWVYDFITDEIIKGPSVPINFRNKILIGHSLPNGNVVYFRVEDNVTTPHDEYIVFDAKSITITEYQPGLETPNFFNSSVRYRSGEIDKSVNDDNGNIDTYRFY